MPALAGGSERTLAQYREVLERGGLALAAAHALPLGIEMLVATPLPAGS